MSFDQLRLAGESQTLEFKNSFDKAMVNAKRDYPEVSFAAQEIGGGVLLAFGRVWAEQPEAPGAALQQGSEKSNDGRLRRIGSDKGGYWQVLEAS